MAIAKTQQLFEVAVLLHPTSAEHKEEGAETICIMTPKTYLASDENSVLLKVARDIDSTYADQLDQCEVLIRPFA